MDLHFTNITDGKKASKKRMRIDVDLYFINITVGTKAIKKDENPLHKMDNRQTSTLLFIYLFIFET